MSALDDLVIPPVTAEFIRELRNAFRPNPIRVDSSRDQIMWDAGQQYMIDWIEAKALGGRVILGEIPEKPVEEKQTLMTRLFNNRLFK